MIAKYARAYELKTCTDMTWAEIARALGIRHNTLRSKINLLISNGYKENEAKSNQNNARS